jgi:hypothetical protein
VSNIILPSKPRQHTSRSQQSGWPEPLGANALYGLPGKFLAAIDPHTDSDPVANLMQFLIAFGNLICGFRRPAIESLRQSIEGRAQC